MIPKKDHLQIIVKELERFESDLEKSYNFQEFFDRCRAIFSPELQIELSTKMHLFQERELLDVISAQNILFSVRVERKGGRRILKNISPDGDITKRDLDIVELEYGLRAILVWCRKQIIKMVKDEQIDFKDIPSLDIKNL